MTNSLNAAARALNGAGESCILMPYDDARPKYSLEPGDKVLGTLTQGWGHTGPDIVIGRVWTQDYADQMREKDLQRAASVVDAAVHVPLTDNQFGVLTDFEFNIGVTAFTESTLLKDLNGGNYAAVPDQLPRWVNTTIKGKKTKSLGLVARRQREASLWSVPDEKQAQAVQMFTPATEPSVTPCPVPQKTIGTSVTAACIIAAPIIPAVGPHLQDAASQMAAFSDLSHWITPVSHWLGLTAVGCALFGHMRSLIHHNDSVST